MCCHDVILLYLLNPRITQVSSKSHIHSQDMATLETLIVLHPRITTVTHCSHIHLTDVYLFQQIEADCVSIIKFY